MEWIMVALMFLPYVGGALLLGLIAWGIALIRKGNARRHSTGDGSGPITAGIAMIVAALIVAALGYHFIYADPNPRTLRLDWNKPVSEQDLAKHKNTDGEYLVLPSNLDMVLPDRTPLQIDDVDAVWVNTSYTGAYTSGRTEEIGWIKVDLKPAPWKTVADQVRTLAKNVSGQSVDPGPSGSGDLYDHEDWEGEVTGHGIDVDIVLDDKSTPGDPGNTFAELRISRTR